MACPFDGCDDTFSQLKLAVRHVKDHPEAAVTPAAESVAPPTAPDKKKRVRVFLPEEEAEPVDAPAAERKRTNAFLPEELTARMAALARPPPPPPQPLAPKVNLTTRPGVPAPPVPAASSSSPSNWREASGLLSTRAFQKRALTATSPATMTTAQAKASKAALDALEEMEDSLLCWM